ncbi:MAG: hypothetical protein HC788_00295 [Sphingopyxis sp.]|nr:hypothetical protein [Sphingopyxis sp.]
MEEFAVMRKIGKWALRITGVLLLIAIIPVSIKVREYGYATTRITARVVCPMVYIDGRDVPFALNHLSMLGILPFDPRSIVSVSLSGQARSHCGCLWHVRGEIHSLPRRRLRLAVIAD